MRSMRAAWQSPSIFGTPASSTQSRALHFFARSGRRVEGEQRIGSREGSTWWNPDRMELWSSTPDAVARVVLRLRKQRPERLHQQGRGWSSDQCPSESR